MRILPLPAGVGDTHEAAVALYHRIADELGVEVATVAWRGQGLLGISAHAYNAPDDYARLAAGLPLDW